MQVGSSIEVKSGPKTMHFVIVGSEEADPALGKYLTSLYRKRVFK